METRLAYIALNQIRGVGPRSVQKWLELYETPERILQCNHEELAAIPTIGEKRAVDIARQFSQLDPEAEVRRAAALQVEIITQADEAYLPHCALFTMLLWHSMCAAASLPPMRARSR